MRHLLFAIITIAGASQVRLMAQGQPPLRLETSVEASTANNVSNPPTGMAKAGAEGEKLSAPMALSIDTNKSVYVFDKQEEQYVAYKYDPNGKGGRKVASFGPWSSNNGMRPFAVDRVSGSIYCVEEESAGSIGRRLWKLVPNPNDEKDPYRREAFGAVLSNAEHGIVLDGDGNVFVSGDGWILKYNSSGKYIAAAQAGNGCKVLGADSKNRIYYATDNGTKLWRAGFQSSKLENVERIETNGSFSALAIDDAGALYIADNSKGTIRKHSSEAGDPNEVSVPGHFGDLSAIAVNDKKLYIANGVDGVLKVDAATGECFGAKLFSLQDEPQYFVQNAVSKGYYIGCEKKILVCDQNGRDQGVVWEGDEVGGVGLDGNQNLVFIGKKKDGDLIRRLCWRQAGKTEVQMRLFLDGRSLSVRGNDVCFLQGVKVHSTKLHPANDSIDPTYMPIAIGSDITRVAGFKEGALYLDGNDVYYTTSVTNTKKVLEGLVNPKAIAGDEKANIYVTNEGSDPHIGKYTDNGKHRFDLIMKSAMKGLRDLFVDSDGSVVVLQKDGVWRYSNTFIR